MTEDTFVCKRSDKIEHIDNGFLVPNVGMVSQEHMTDADLDAWHKHNAQVNPDSYDEEELKEEARDLGYACMFGEYPHEWKPAHHLKQGGFQCVACDEWRQTIDDDEHGENLKKQLKRNAVQFEQVVDIDGNPTGEVIANVPIPHESKKLREMRKKAEKRQRYLANNHRREEE